MSAWRLAEVASGVGGTRQGGFSLLELLVALIVVVLITSMVSLTVTSGGSDIQLEAMVRNLADTAAYALDEAQFTGNDHGLLLDEEIDETGARRFGWRWQERTLEGWREPEPEREVFASQLLPPGFMLELELEEAPLVELTLDDEDEPPSPQVVYYASGEVTVGAINLRRLADSELLWRIEWDLLGRTELLRRGEAREEED